MVGHVLAQSSRERCVSENYSEKLQTRIIQPICFGFFRADSSCQLVISVWSWPNVPDLSRRSWEFQPALDFEAPSHARTNSSQSAIFSSPAAEEKKRGQGREWSRAREYTWRMELPPSLLPFSPPSWPSPSSPPRLKFTSRIAADLISSALLRFARRKIG